MCLETLTLEFGMDQHQKGLTKKGHVTVDLLTWRNIATLARETVTAPPNDYTVSHQQFKLTFSFALKQDHVSIMH